MMHAQQPERLNKLAVVLQYRNELLVCAAKQQSHHAYIAYITLSEVPTSVILLMSARSYPLNGELSIPVRTPESKPARCEPTTIFPHNYILAAILTSPRNLNPLNPKPSDLNSKVVKALGMRALTAPQQCALVPKGGSKRMTVIRRGEGLYKV